MFRRECTLCGGRLDGNHVCRECGLDNKKTDANYAINRSSCDRKLLTHVHEEQSLSGRDKSKNNKNNEKIRPKKGKRAAKIAIIFAIAGVALELVKSGVMIVPEILEENFDSASVPEYYNEDYDPYGFVTREIPAEGYEYVTSLGQGEYVVGVHLPEGIYICTTSGSYASIDVQDEENSIWLYEWVDEEQPELLDVRLYEGAIIEIYGDKPMVMVTSNAQGECEKLANPLGESTVSIQTGALAGEDYMPGVYDIRAEDGYGEIVIEICDEKGEMIESKFLWLDSDYPFECRYANLVLPSGSSISWGGYDDLKISLITSEQIVSEDYLGYYGY